MYSEKEIQIALGEYIASNGNTSIDEQGIINILNQGADRDFAHASQAIKAIRMKFGVKSRIPEWLRMLTFRLIYDCMASDVGNNSEMALYRSLGYEKKAKDLFSSIGLDCDAQNMLLSVKGDKLKIKEALFELVLGKEQEKIIKQLKKKKVGNAIKEKLENIGVAQSIQNKLLGIQSENAKIKEKQIKELLIESVLGSRAKDVFDILMLQAKTQENLLNALGFNKKVFDGTSWKMYSPDMKLRQRRFNPVDFPFAYAEVESNPIYVAMLHYLISEARVPTDTFIDVFGKMGYVPAFCADGYAHKLIYTHNSEAYLKYFHGITDRPTKTYEIIQGYMSKIEAALEEKLDSGERDEKIRSIVSDASLMRGIYSSDLSEYAAVKFCDLCFRKKYWEERNVEKDPAILYGLYKFEESEESEESDASEDINDLDVAYQLLYNICEKMIADDYSSIKRAKQFASISKEDFLSYAASLKKIECSIESSNKNLPLYNEWFNIAKCRNAFLYVDVPKIREYERFDYSSEECKKLMEILASYKGDWILTWKEYSYNYLEEVQEAEYLLNQLRQSKKPLFEFKYSTTDNNVRNGIRFITTIDFDILTNQEFQNRYSIKLHKKEKINFKKKKLN